MLATAALQNPRRQSFITPLGGITPPKPAPPFPANDPASFSKRSWIPEIGANDGWSS